MLDSTADLPGAIPTHPNWRVVPLHIRFGEQGYRDWLDISPDDVLRRLGEPGPLPTTSQPSPGELAAAYESLSAYERVLSVHISSRLSGTFDSARLAAEAQGGRVLPIDSRAATVGVVLVAEALQRRLERGATEAELLAAADRVVRGTRVVSTYHTLAHLARTGRVGKARKLAAQVLNAKPILELRDGEQVPIGSVRGWARALARLAEALEAETTGEGRLHVAIAHAGAAADAERLAADVRRRRPRAAIDLVTSFGPVTASAVGPGAVALCFLEDDL